MPGVSMTDWEHDEAGRTAPAKITVADFRRYFLMSFPKLRDEKYDGLIQDAIDTVYAMFTGVNTMWDTQPDTVWYEKSHVCYRLLAAWFIAGKHPEMAAHTLSIDGVRQKKVDGVTLTFDTGMISDKTSGVYQDALAALQSNHFGRMALLMIRASAKRAMLRNRRIT